MDFNNLFEKHLTARQNCAANVESRAREVQMANNLLDTAKRDATEVDENLLNAALSHVMHIVTVASNTYSKTVRHITYDNRPVVPGLDGYDRIRVIDWDTAKFEQLSKRRLVFSVCNLAGNREDTPDRYCIAVPLEWFGCADGMVASQMRNRIRAEIQVRRNSFWRKELRFVENLVQMWEEANQRDEKPDNAEAVLAGFLNERDILKERLSNG